MTNEQLLDRPDNDATVSAESGLTLSGFVSPADLAYDEPFDRVEFNFGISRRTILQALGTGILIAVCDLPLAAQEEEPSGARGGGGRGRGGGGFRGGGPVPVSARLHIGKDGAITVFAGKVEGGQGARAELTEAAAEELRVPIDRITMVLADTALVPNDGMTAGSGTTPNTVPAVRQGAAAARNLLEEMAAKKWSVEQSEVEARDGKVVHSTSKRELSYSEIASDEDAIKALKETTPQRPQLTPVSQWKALGHPTARPNRRDLVTGAHKYPSDIIRPAMLHGKVLRAAHFGLSSKPAQLKSVDTSAAKAMDGVTVVRDGDFIGVVAPTNYQAAQAIEAIAEKAEWEQPEHPASKNLFEHLEKTARGSMANPNKEEMSTAAKTVKADYHVAYAQHAPMEPRAAIADWEDDKLTVWTSTQNPFGVRTEVARALRLPEEKVRVIVPDFGGGFGGKHPGECAVEAARLAKAAGKPVALHWTRAEEFTWAQFRPAGVIKAEASLDADGKITSWFAVNINSGNNSLAPMYRTGKRANTMFLQAAAPLRHGSYRALAATANTFANESFVDELADAAGKDPLDFRLAHLEDERLRGVLEEAAKKFDWATSRGKREKNVGVGLACGFEKRSYVAACAEVEVDPSSGQIKVRRVSQAFDCGAVINPENLVMQVQGAIIMGLGPALREEMKFENGQMQNAAFSKYLVPRFDDVPQIDITLVNHTEQQSVGAGETPIIAIAPAIANAVFHATGQRIRQMPLKLAAVSEVMICGIVLAAGQSRRMGTQKLLLPWAAKTVVAHIVDETLAAGIDRLLVVVSNDAERIAQALSGRPVTLVTNPDPDGDMLSSIRCGLRAVSSDCDTALVILGDQPGIDADLIKGVLRAREKSGKGIAMPIAAGKRGHPIAIASKHFPEVLANFDGIGLHGLLDAYPDDLYSWPIADAALLADMDFPQDYERHQAAQIGQQREPSD